ncbi:hypothetical protein EIN_471700 [Entamoeba invadens IP1]|uniref:Uncharacterized protein n=1 Tax=Entamoeba invadens IP1 TaxID=370355 RepID=L7FL71_ENTIV|nr:hypothetical protein EIN_471700 [Entamoeba invadens IP1]ELP86801.1 hypothetical protein EIN_471700 [Entamoeba invadens IP1]|eukprot:XP_004253572.1 hypothetical protein EIN_471700 [Entamoeba invadens IP1]
MYVLFFVFVLTTNGYQCQCTPAGTDDAAGFIPLNCDKNHDTICFSYNFIFFYTTYYFNEIVITNNLGLYSYIDFQWQNINGFTIISNFVLLCFANIHSNNNFYIKPKAVINVLKNTTAIGRLSIAGNIELENPELNNPQIIMWNSTYLHLNYKYVSRQNFEIKNPTGNTKCFDVISLNDKSNIDTSTNTDHITSDMFNYSYNFTDGKGYLISNKKLIRFCPNGILLDKDVVCTLKSQYYKIQSPINMEYTFDYPHCHCNDDANVNCKLKFTSEINEFGFFDADLSNTELLVDRNVTIFRLKQAKQVNIYDDVELSISSYFNDSKFVFTFGSVTTSDEKNDYKFASFKYSTSSNTFVCEGNLNYDLSLNQNITNFKIECPNIIKSLNLYENSKIFISKGTISSKICQINFSEFGKSFVFIANTNNNEVVSNCYLFEVTKNRVNCILCTSKYQLVNGKVFSS